MAIWKCFRAGFYAFSNLRPNVLAMLCVTGVAVMLFLVHYSGRVAIQVSTKSEAELFGDQNTLPHVNANNMQSLKLAMKQVNNDMINTSSTRSVHSTKKATTKGRTVEEVALPSTNARNSSSNMSSSEESRHIAFLKVHKAGSTTVQNIVYRFGMARNLTFVLSGDNHYLSKSKNKYNTLYPVIPGNPDGWTKYDILCNHVVFNKEKFAELMYDDAVYFAIVREPLDLFISAAYYYRFIVSGGYLTNIPPDSFIQSLLHHPDKYEPSNLSQSRTYNYMSHDFGMEIHSLEHAKNITVDSFKTFLDEVANTFKLVLVMERFDESLILLRRHLKWTIKDILYVKGNTYNVTAANITEGNASSIEQTFKISKSNLTESDIQAFNKRNWMDVKLYEFFSKRFDDQVKMETNFTMEVRCFQEYLKDTSQFCATVDNLNITNHVELGSSSCSEAFIVSTEDCALMLQEELTFYFDLISKRKRKLNLH